MERDLQRSLRVFELMHPRLMTISRALDRIGTSGIVKAINQIQSQQALIARALSLPGIAVPQWEI